MILDLIHQKLLQSVEKKRLDVNRLRWQKAQMEQKLNQLKQEVTEKQN